MGASTSGSGPFRGSEITLVWVPGLMHTQEFYQQAIDALANDSIHSTFIDLPFNGESAATAASDDDWKATWAQLETLVEKEEKEVGILAHSYGGIPACMSVRGLERSARAKQGLRGGIVNVVFLAAFVLPQRKYTFELLNFQPPPFAIRLGNIWVPNMDVCPKFFFSDLDDESAPAWTNKLVQASHQHCITPVKNPCWDVDVKKTYIYTNDDVGLPRPVQWSMLQSAIDSSWTIREIPSNHDPFLSQLKKFAGIVKDLLESS